MTYDTSTRRFVETTRQSTVSKPSGKNEPIQEAVTRDGDSVSDDSTGYVYEGEHDSAITAPFRLGEYLVRGLLGSGGMGQVFLAEHVRMQRTVALKMLPVHLMKNQSAVDRFYQEVRAASRVMHPNIVTAFDAGEYEGIHYLAMEYIDGKTLTQVVSDTGPLSLGEAAAVIRQASMGLLHAHRAGIVHRDVKPGNLMRASDGAVKVLDLGLARASNLRLKQQVDSGGKRAPASGDEAGKRPSKGRLVGTLPYMSPEQLEDPDSADSRSDIYSLGATLYFLLTGNPPFTGEFLEQVYGHRHGEIPDLMQARDDVDLRFAHLFNRMMAKSPKERYASLDEVIEELTDYCDRSATPGWLSDFTQRQSGAETSTARSSSTSGRTSCVMGVELGMFYAAASRAEPGGRIETLQAGDNSQPLFRLAVSSDDQEIVFGSEAITRRSEEPQKVAHCLPMYLGQRLVERRVGGRNCPPEVLLAMMIRRLVRNSQKSSERPDAVAITVPATYDQLRRRSILQAASMAGVGSVRLVDRSLAVAQTLLLDATGSESEDQRTAATTGEGAGFEIAPEQSLLYLGLTGQSSEAAIIRRGASRMQQLSAAGHWHDGTLSWLHRLVDYAAEAFLQQEKFDPREKLKSAARLQIACERVMNSLLLMPRVELRLELNNKSYVVPLERSEWLRRCDDLAHRTRRSVEIACDRAGVALDEIDLCLTMGPLLRIPVLQKQILAGLRPGTSIKAVDRIEASRGAAACLACELPGRSDVFLPPRNVTSQSIGIVVDDSRGRRRILPVIPQGTLLPARTNRRLTFAPDRPEMTLSVVESAGLEGDDWQALGRYEFSLEHPAEASEASLMQRTRMIAFSIDVNGLLTVRAQQPGMPDSVRLKTLPEPTLPDEDLPIWAEWISEIS